MPTPLSFNANWYLSQNPDVAAAIEAGAPFNAFEHFSLYGSAENRSASPLFDPEQYLANNPDVAEAVAQGLITAWDHFELFGGEFCDRIVVLKNTELNLTRIMSLARKFQDRIGFLMNSLDGVWTRVDGV